MAELFAPCIVAQIAAVERELKMRRSVYPRWIASKKMTREKADYEIGAMEAVLRTLERVRDERG